MLIRYLSIPVFAFGLAGTAEAICPKGQMAEPYQEAGKTKIRCVPLRTITGQTSAPAKSYETGNYGYENGRTLPAYILEDINGQRISSTSFDDRWVILKRGAQWCAPCVKERLFVESFRRAHPNIAVIFVTIKKKGASSGIETARRQLQQETLFLKGNGYSTDNTYIIVSKEPTAVTAPKYFRQVPATFILAPNRAVVDSWSGFPSKHYSDTEKGIFDDETTWKEYVEAVLLCNGVIDQNDSVNDRSIAISKALDRKFCVSGR